jgi:hypothetical protein
MKNHSSVLCHLGKPRAAKPQTIQEYGQLRDVMIQSPWVSVSEELFIDLVTLNGSPFYGCLFNGHDLLTEANGQQKNCWRMQTLLGLDFDKVDISPGGMTRNFINRGLEPWLVYRTFSDGTNGKRSYRMLWQVERDLNLTYEEVGAAIKGFATNAGGLADKHSMDPSRLWQGSNRGKVYHSPNSAKLNLQKGLL